MCEDGGEMWWTPAGTHGPPPTPSPILEARGKNTLPKRKPPPPAARVYRRRLPPSFSSPDFDGSLPPLTVVLAVGVGGDLRPALSPITRSVMLDFDFGLHSGIGVVVATMASWNNVSPASPYLINVSGVGEEAVRVRDVRSVSFL